MEPKLWSFDRQPFGPFLFYLDGQTIKNVISPQDYDFLHKAGASLIFGPGTKLPVAALEVVNLISGHLEKQKYAEKNWTQAVKLILAA